jgi:hypothetical protein
VGLGCVTWGEVIMRSFKLPLAGALALSVFAAANASQAQSKADESLIYEFDDDDLMGDALGTTSALIRLRPDAARVTLIRPRASFVSEMLKSVELL